MVRGAKGEVLLMVEIHKQNTFWTRKFAREVGESETPLPRVFLQIEGKARHTDALVEQQEGTHAAGAVNRSQMIRQCLLAYARRRNAADGGSIAHT